MIQIKFELKDNFACEKGHSVMLAMKAYLLLLNFVFNMTTGYSVFPFQLLVVPSTILVDFDSDSNVVISSKSRALFSFYR